MTQAIHRLANAISALKLAYNPTDDDLTSSRIHDAEIACYKALRQIADSQLGSLDDPQEREAKKLLESFGPRLDKEHRWIDAALARMKADDQNLTGITTMKFHDIYKTDDIDAPSQIQDSNGEVVLQSCRVCGGGEASLPTQCPGIRMTGDQLDEVQAGTLDFDNGQWLTPAKAD